MREMGFIMLQEAVRLTRATNYNNTYGTAQAVVPARTRMAKDLGKAIEDRVEEFLQSIFSDKYAHHAAIRLVSTWLVSDYYREYCYEDDTVDLMKFLVDAAVHETERLEEQVHPLPRTHTHSLSH